MFVLVFAVQVAKLAPVTASWTTSWSGALSASEGPYW